MSDQHSQEAPRRSAEGVMLASAPREQNVPAPTSAGPQQLWWGSCELQRAHYNAQPLGEIKGTSDKAWVSLLLHGIDNACCFHQMQWTTLSFHCMLFNFLGPFHQCPLKDLPTLGLGAIPKKSSKWRVILHLSAPEGLGINDFIAKEDFTFHYSTINDTWQSELLGMQHWQGSTTSTPASPLVFAQLPAFV